ncbi:nematode fatty acid retinoid binding protein [Necator americanus]|uniref:Fatty-acid and retinol-binding protein 1 n=1 Tax=Necator americanus TaxID=51031 RepID=W2SRJ3_NECAM|nr:nematode fatty acid retinoid binding protein [Necator americanus]ETN71481.1 nematode fatty acid retinoid binding protein [Necator americanus]
MIRQIALIVLLFTQFLLVPAFKYEDIPADYRDLMPPEARDFLQNLSDGDKTVLKEVFKAGPYKNTEESIAALKKKSPELGAKVEKLHAMVKSKIAALGPEAKGFAEKSIEIARGIKARYYTGNEPTKDDLKASVKEVLKLYKAMSDAGKADFGKQFPFLAKVFESGKAAKFAGEN